MRQPITPHPGSADDPDDFVGRATTTRRATEMLLAGQSLMLTDPRRMGKSYWMAYFCATTSDFEPVQIDYEGVGTQEEFLLRTAEKLATLADLPDKARRVLTGFFENFDEVAVGPLAVKRAARAMSARTMLSETLRSVDREPGEKPLLICMDEVPIGVRNIALNQGPQAAREILQTLRALRHESKTTRWVVCGSIGFHHVLDQCGATEGEINDLETLPLGPLTHSDAAELARRLFLGIRRDWTDEAPGRLAEMSGGIPFIIQKVAALLQHTRQETGPLSVTDVVEGFNEFIDDRDESRAVTHLLTRLDLFYGDQVSDVEKLLDDIALQPRLWAELHDAHAESMDVLKLVDSLVDDHYLQTRSGLVSWRYDVLRRVWLQRRRLA